MTLRARLIGAAVLALAAGGGAVVAQVVGEQAPERSAAPPPSELEPATPAAAAPLSNAVAPDEAAPPPEAIPAQETVPTAPAAAANTAAAPSPQEEEPPGPPPPPPPPLKRPRFATAILQATDKSTSDTLRFEAKIGQPIRYKGLTMVVHACETNNAEDDPYADSYAHLEISSQPQTVAGRRAPPARQVFRGWMVGSSQSLHPLEHPLYDLWLIACKTDAPPAPGSNL